MRKVKHMLIAAVLAAGALMLGTTPRSAAAEVSAAAEAAAMLEDGLYWILDSQGRIAGHAIVENGQVVEIKYYGEFRYT